MKRTMMIIAGIVVIGVLGSAFLYNWQHQSVTPLQKEQDTLNARLSLQQHKLAAVEAIAKVDTSSWTKYCDPITKLCFKYPKDWTLTGGKVDEFNYVTATITDPQQKVKVQYYSPLIRDGGSMSEHIVRTSGAKIQGQDFNIIGSYNVSSGTYAPIYSIMDTKYTKDLKPGTIDTVGELSRFNVGTFESIRLAAGPATPLSNESAAQVWFTSADGYTALAILQSFGQK